MNGVAQSIEAGGARDDIPTMDQRRDPRFTLLIRAAKILSPCGEYMCILRDASVSGVRAQIFHPLPAGRRFVLEMPNGERHRVETVWERESHAGFRFEGRVELERLIGDPGPFPKRPVRLAVQMPALLSHAGQSSAAVIRNLSQSGARIDCQTHLAVDQKLRLEAEQLTAIQACVRWRKNTEYGVVFDRTFRFDELACLVARLQQPGGDCDEGTRFESLHFM